MPISLTLAIAEFLPEALPVVVTPTTSPVSTPADAFTRWDIRAVTQDNTGIYAFYPGAQVNNITWNYNTPDTAEVAISIDDINLTQLDPDHSDCREIQIWRNGHLLFVGKPWTRRVDNTGRLMVFSCKDPTAYLQRRYIGRANRVNLLHNPGFEAGVGPWQQFDPGSTMTIGASGAHKLVGSDSLAVVCTDVSQGPFVFQQIVVTAGAKDLRLFLTGWYYVTALTASSPFDAGLLLFRNVTGTGAGKYSYAKIKKDTQVNQWVRLETFVRVPAGRTERIQARLFPVDGTIYWDAITLVADEYLSWGDGTDQGRVVSDIVNYLQGKGPFADLSPEKSDCHIRPVMPTTGVGVQAGRVYHLADHQKGFDGSSGSRAALDHYLNASDGIDWRFEPAGRVLRGYSPAIGEDRTEVTWTWRKFPLHPERDSSYGIVGWTFADSEETAANQIVELGGWGGSKYPGDPTREEGGYSNPSSLGGLSVEMVETAPQGMPISQLDARAAARGARLSRPIATLQLTLAEPRDPTTGDVSYPLIGVLYPGDTIAVDLVEGTFVLSGDWRVAQVSLDGQTDELTVTPNPVIV